MSKINREIINVKKITVETEEETMIYDGKTVKQVFKTRPDTTGRLHLGTQNRVLVIEFQ